MSLKKKLNLNNDYLQPDRLIVKDGTPKSDISKFSAIVFTKEPEPTRLSEEQPIAAKDTGKKTDKAQSEEDYDDFEDDFEPYETSHEDEEKKTERTNPTTKTHSNGMQV